MLLWQILKQMVHKQGYPILPLNLRDDSGKINSFKILVQRMVAICHVPNPDNKPFVIQKDGDKLNVNADNLEWVTEAERYAHQKSLGKRPAPAKLNKREVSEIKARLQKRASIGLLSVKYAISKKAIDDIRIGATWKNVAPAED